MNVNVGRFFRDEEGQDLIEYTLLLAMVCLASAALMIGSGAAMSGIWCTTNNNLSAAYSFATQ
jgi:Flp pilus assembly pilin Flp